MLYNASKAASLYAELDRVLGRKERGNNTDQCDNFIHTIEKLIAKSGTLQYLREAGIKQRPSFIGKRCINVL